MTELFATLLVVFAVDRTAKMLAFRRPGPEGRSALAGLVTIRPHRNPRPRLWPAGSRASWVLSFGFALAAGSLLVLIDPFAGPAVRFGLGAALGGALGNLYDRLRHGAVLDFLELGRGGLFNPADAALVLGLCTVLGSHVCVAVQGAVLEGGR